MPQFRFEALIPFTPQSVYGFFCTPREMLKLAPAGVTVVVESAPEKAVEGSEVRVSVRAMGFSQKARVLVTEAVPYERLSDRQLEGPFKMWEQTHTFTADAAGGGTRVQRTVAFQPPGGMLGMFITEARILEGLESLSRFQFAEVGRLLAETGGT